MKNLLRFPTGAFALVVALVALAGPAATHARGNDEAAHAAITADDMLRTVERLAADDLQGREAGTAGGRKAGDWLVAQIERLGLQPGGDDGTFFQSFSSPDDAGVTLRNIVATLPAREGSDRAGECVVVGSHYDHVGMGALGALDPFRGHDKVHHGADDNASGSAGTLAVARAFAAAGPARRRIVFVWFDGEEKGLYGSLHYVRHPCFPLEKTAAMLNMDMIGRLRKERLMVYGLNTGSTFPGVFREAARETGLEIDDHEALPPNSDYFSFYEKKVPVIALFTGLHGDYHRATDTADKIVAPGMARIARLAYDTTRALADRDDRPRFARAKDGNAEAMLEQVMAMLEDSDLQKLFGGEDGIQRLFKEGGIAKVLERLRGPSGRPRLGIGIQETEQGVVVDRVTRASVAEKAGIQKGDLIVALGGREVSDFDSLRAAVALASGRVKVELLRDGERVEVEADLGPGRRGGQGKRWY